MSQGTNPLMKWTTDLWPWLQPPGGVFSQPILPGWTLNINSNNSSAPQTELAVVDRHSYGRQLGRISDALRVLVLEHGRKKGPEDGAVAQFLSMWEEIEQVKTESAVARLDAIASDLARVKKNNAEEYRRLRDALGRALKQNE